MSGGQARGMLALEGIRRVQALTFLMGVEHHHADVRPAVDISQAQDLPFAQNQRGMRPAGKPLFAQAGSGVKKVRSSIYLPNA